MHMLSGGSTVNQQVPWHRGTGLHGKASARSLRVQCSEEGVHVRGLPGSEQTCTR